MPPIKTVHKKKYLLPLSWIYGFIVFVRNKFFDWNILEQKEYDIPIICVGNITVGGTGKTPHIEYLTRILISKHYKVAVVSRGYRRKTKGFILSTVDSTAKQIGDEPFQIKNKFPNILVAVDSKRTRAVDKLLSLSDDQKPDVILLDDAYQHRYIKPSYTILLTDFNRLITQDALLPAGRLREPAHYSEFANSIIVTKCPRDINPLDKRITSKELNIYPYQDLFYTTFAYGNLIPVFRDVKNEVLDIGSVKKYDVLIVTGIANPRELYKRIRISVRKYQILKYPDHHNFTSNDIYQIESKFAEIGNEKKLIIVTEKDASRLCFMNNISDEVKNNLYYIPIEVDFSDTNEQNLFDAKIVEHVRKYK